MLSLFLLSVCTMTAAILPPSSRIEKERAAAAPAAAAAAPAATIYDRHLGPDGRLQPLQPLQQRQEREDDERSELSLRQGDKTAAALQRRQGEDRQEPLKEVARRPELFLPEDDEAYEIRLTTVRPRRTTAQPYQDYPDYDLPVRAGWPPPQEHFPSVYGERRPVQQPVVRPIIQAAAPIEEYRPAVAAAAPFAPLRFRQRRPNDVFLLTKGAYPEYFNMNAIGERFDLYRPPTWDGSGIPDIGLPHISDPAVPLLPVENYPSVPYPNLPGYPGRPPPYDGAGSYRPRPARVVDSGYGERYVEPNYSIRGGYATHAPDYGMQPYRRPDVEYGRPTVPSFRSFPSQPTEERGGRGFRTIKSPYGYSYAGYIEKQSRLYPIMIYTLESCPACHSAKRLLAINYADVASHFLELAGEEEWQRQLHIDLQNLTGAGRFPYVFVCGHFIGGSMDLHDLHRRGQLRHMLQQCSRERPQSAAGNWQPYTVSAAAAAVASKKAAQR